jgi:MCM P-loop domain
MLLDFALQGAEASGGMVNIRADEEMTPEEVLQGFSDADAQDVEAMVQDPQVGELMQDTDHSMELYVVKSFSTGLHIMSEDVRHMADRRMCAMAALCSQLQVYQNITRSIAPGVHGHEDVKRAIALMLFGGVHKQTSEVLLQCLLKRCTLWPSTAYIGCHVDGNITGQGVITCRLTR